MTKEQEKQMNRVFPNGWEESDIPAFWRRDKRWMEERKAEEHRQEDLDKRERKKLGI